jgi:hypothetical protein
VTTATAPASVQIEHEVRVTCPGERGVLARILKVLRTAGGGLRAHLVYRFYEQSTAFFLCDNPEEGALALERAGVRVEMETVVTVAAANRPGLFSHLVQTIEAEQIDIAYSYATASGDRLLVVLRTSNNPRAEDVLRNYLLRPDPSLPGKPEAPAATEAPGGGGSPA